MISEKLASLAQVVRNCVDGKSAIAQAVTSKGVATNPSDRWDDIAINIGLIGGGGAEGDVGYFDVARSSEMRTIEVLLSGDYSGIQGYDYYAIYCESLNAPSDGDVYAVGGFFQIHPNPLFTKDVWTVKTYFLNGTVSADRFNPILGVYRLSADRITIQIGADTDSVHFAEGSWQLKLIKLS